MMDNATGDWPLELCFVRIETLYLVSIVKLCCFELCFLRIETLYLVSIVKLCCFEPCFAREIRTKNLVLKSAAKKNFVLSHRMSFQFGSVQSILASSTIS